ncbi:hypothetical protein [Sulfuricurvum sp.]|uniref:hypothetical protein n=1 Tax=Sulfuricurvum sp. TaxID=2025608 RepID=UPI0019B32D9C|nr:hypothetical protein [Sulfuricurvum sp.]MBD3799668.1 hypothetical protein [Campylobacterota bacterium]MBD3807059.1 hypothetical protein [Sulfuricurvum sp.]
MGVKKKRIVYYFSGSDLRSVRHYYALYKEHFQKQSVINGSSGIVLPRKKIHNYLYQRDIVANDHGRTALLPTFAAQFLYDAIGRMDRDHTL